MTSLWSPEGFDDVKWPVYRKKKIWPIATTKYRRELISLSKELYWSPLSIDISKFDMWRHLWRHFNVISRIFWKNPFFDHCDVFFVKTVFNISHGDNWDQEFSEECHIFFLSLQTKELQRFENDECRDGTFFFETANFKTLFLDYRWIF